MRSTKQGRRRQPEIEIVLHPDPDAEGPATPRSESPGPPKTQGDLDFESGVWVRILRLSSASGRVPTRGVPPTGDTLHTVGRIFREYMERGGSYLQLWRALDQLRQERPVASLTGRAVEQWRRKALREALTALTALHRLALIMGGKDSAHLQDMVKDLATLYSILGDDTKVKGYSLQMGWTRTRGRPVLRGRTNVVLAAIAHEFNQAHRFGRKKYAELACLAQVFAPDLFPASIGAENMRQRILRAPQGEVRTEHARLFPPDNPPVD